MFENAEKYLKSFYRSRKDDYKGACKDFHPTRHQFYGYQEVLESHRLPIYQSINDLNLFFGNGQDILDLSIPDNFATPQAAVKAIKDYKTHLEDDKRSLEKFLPEYRQLPKIPDP